MDLNQNPIIRYFPDFIQGLGLTIELTLLSLLIGFGMAVATAWLRLRSSPFLWMPAYGYMFFFRGTPLLIQIYLLYFGVAQLDFVRETPLLWEVFRGAYWPAIFALSLNTGAYTAEILRGAMRNLPYGEIEAGRAFGMSPWLLFWRIKVPHIIRIGLPAYSNEVILMLHASSLASLVTLLDLTGMARRAASYTYETKLMYGLAGLIYLAATYALLWGFRLLERRVAKQFGVSSGRPASPAAIAKDAALSGNLLLR